MVDGRRVHLCFVLGSAVVGLSGEGEPLYPLQRAFLEGYAFQCGYCTSGHIMSAIACVTEGHIGTADEIREYMTGNLCRLPPIQQRQGGDGDEDADGSADTTSGDSLMRRSPSNAPQCGCRPCSSA